MIKVKSVGRPRWSPTKDDRKKVEMMASIGIPQAKIAAVMRISEKTLRARCRLELVTAGIVADTQVARFLFDQATGRYGKGGPAVAAAIFWAKTRMGWKETVISEHVGEDGKPKQAEIADARQRAFDILDQISQRLFVGNHGDFAGGPAPDGAARSDDLTHRSVALRGM